MTKNFEIDDIYIIEDLETIKVATDPLRLDIMRAMGYANKAGKLITVKQLAVELNLPPTKLYYHIKLLEEHGLIKVADTKIVSGIIEKHYQVTSYQITVKELSLSEQEGTYDEKIQSSMESVSSLLDSVKKDFGKSLTTISRLVIEEKEGKSPAPPQSTFHISKEEMFLTREQADELREMVVSLQEKYQAMEEENLKNESGGLYYSFSFFFNPNYHLTYNEEGEQKKDE